MTWRKEFKVYAQHVLGLLVPNLRAPVHKADRNAAGDVAQWVSEDLDLLIDEGRRQLDRQHDDLERIRSRAQVLLALGLALVGTTAALQGRVSDSSSWLVWAMWLVALATGAWSILGAAATSVVRADMSIIHAAVLSRRSGKIKEELAKDYSEMVMAGENQLATRLTNLRHAVTWLLVAAVLALASWLGSPEPEPAPASACCDQVQARVLMTRR